MDTKENNKEARAIIIAAIITATTALAIAFISKPISAK